MKRIVHVAKSFEEAEHWDIEQNISMTPEERLDILQTLREQYYVLNNISKRKFEKVFKVIQMVK